VSVEQEIEFARIELVEAWYDYLEAVRGATSEEQYLEVESWAWAALTKKRRSINARIRAKERQRDRV
jgi:hypothetical protein